MRHDHDQGLQHDLQVISRQQAQRRRLLAMMVAGGSFALLQGCGGDDTEVASAGSDSSSGSSSSSSSSTSGTGSCIADPRETNGPYPSDGTNTVNGAVSNILLQSPIVRSDIRSSFGSVTGTAPGVPLQLNITVVNTNSACAALSGWGVYVWHCTGDGRYSLYSSGIQDQNYLRGVQGSDANGQLSFMTIVPGCYEGRYPHIHFEVFPTLPSATGAANSVLVSQMALPRDVCTAVYSTGTNYGNSASSLARVSLASDGIFADNTAAQVAAQTLSMSGSVSAGYAGAITIGIAA